MDILSLDLDDLQRRAQEIANRYADCGSYDDSAIHSQVRYDGLGTRDQARYFGPRSPPQTPPVRRRTVTGRPSADRTPRSESRAKIGQTPNDTHVLQLSGSFAKERRGVRDHDMPSPLRPTPQKFPSYPTIKRQQSLPYFPPGRTPTERDREHQSTPQPSRKAETPIVVSVGGLTYDASRTAYVATSHGSNQDWSSPSRTHPALRLPASSELQRRQSEPEVPPSRARQRSRSESLPSLAHISSDSGSVVRKSSKKLRPETRSRPRERSIDPKLSHTPDRHVRHASPDKISASHIVRVMTPSRSDSDDSSTEALSPILDQKLQMIDMFGPILESPSQEAGRSSKRSAKIDDPFTSAPVLSPRETILSGSNRERMTRDNQDALGIHQDRSAAHRSTHHPESDQFTEDGGIWDLPPWLDDPRKASLPEAYTLALPTEPSSPAFQVGPNIDPISGSQGRRPTPIPPQSPQNARGSRPDATSSPLRSPHRLRNPRSPRSLDRTHVLSTIAESKEDAAEVYVPASQGRPVLHRAYTSPATSLAGAGQPWGTNR